MTEQIYCDALQRIIDLCQNSPERHNGELICGRVLEVAQAVIAQSAPLPFKAGDRVRHVLRNQIGTVTCADSMFVQVKFDEPTPGMKESIGTYDRDWFRIYPSGLIIVADAGAAS